MSHLTSWYRRLERSLAFPRWLYALWGLFLLLVALGAHGSSLGQIAISGRDALGEHEPPRYVLAPVAGWLGLEATPAVRGALMMQPRQIRIDEWGVISPWSLSQLSHDPPFPVVNTNLGGGQNMLLSMSSPVWHPTLPARPITWGYFLLGAEGGLAWAWWFPPFACFTVLFLLLSVVLDRDLWLAAFGAFWFCASAYVVCWSLWPAYVTFFAALLCLASYHLLTSRSHAVAALSALLLGLALPGFVMCSYPPWQVPLGWLALVLLGVLLWRDRESRWWQNWVRSLVLLGAAGGLAIGLTASYLQAAWPAMQAMLGSVYPGSRFHSGGDYSFAWLLRGYYNAFHSYKHARGFHNQSEASSFLHLFPVLLLAPLGARKIRKRYDALGWVLTGFVGTLLVYMLVGWPDFLAAVTLMSRSHPPRADIALGLASIVLAMWYLKRFPQDPKGPKRVHWLAAAVAAALAGAHGFAVRETSGSYPHYALIPLVALAVGVGSWLLISGRRQPFMGATAVAVIATSAFFNPLSLGLEHVRSSELSRLVAQLDGDAGERPLWLCYEPKDSRSLCGALISMAGGRSLVGVYQHPQLDFWHKLDPGGESERAYNRFAHVELEPCAPDSCLRFESPADSYWGSAEELPPNMFRLTISPRHPRLRALGARYVVAIGALQTAPALADLPVKYRSARGGFTIYDLAAAEAD